MRRRAHLDGAQRDFVLYPQARINEASLGVEQIDGKAIDDDEIEDDRLRLIFTCCHPALPPEKQVALTLREICDLTTEEIARHFSLRRQRSPNASCARKLSSVITIPYQFLTGCQPHRNYRPGWEPSSKSCI
jgi:predicted RNA polymerase sigma factor